MAAEAFPAAPSPAIPPDPRRRLQVWAGLLLGLGLLTVTTGYAGGTTAPIALTGDAIGNGAGRFTRFGVPVINDAGAAAFRATIATADEKIEAVYTFDAAGLTEVVRGNQRPPDGNGRFEYFSTPLFNTSGAVAFWVGLLDTRGIARSSDDEGVFLARGGGITQLVREGQPAPHGPGTVEGFLSYDFNAAGIISFLLATLRDGRTEWGVYLGRGGALTRIAQQGAAAPHGNGRFMSFGGPALNDAGEVAFSAVTAGTGGPQRAHAGVYKGRGGPLTPVAWTGQPAPDGNGRFTGFNAPVLNAPGEVAFTATLTDTRSGKRDAAGVFRGAGGPLTPIARAGQPAPDGNGFVSDFNAPALNDSGVVAFSAYLTGTRAGARDDSGVFLGYGGPLTQIAREGERTPDGTAVFRELDVPALNRAGVLAFNVVLAPADGRGAGRHGIYLGNGRELFPAVRTGDAVAGGTIAAVRFRGGGKPAGRRALNAFGQLVYYGSLADGREGVFLFTPVLHWRSAAGGAWDDAANWTLGLPPGAVHEVVLDPPGTLTVTGPAADAVVRRLVVGGDAGSATLRLTGGTIRSAEPVALRSGGVLTGAGTIDAELDNRGTVQAEDVTVTGRLRNHALVLGSGRLHATLVNAAGGAVRVGAGERLRLTGPGSANAGLFTVTGGELGVSHRLANEAGGRIDADGAVLRFDGGLANAGLLRAGSGAVQLFGVMVNDGDIAAADGARISFHGAVTNNTGIHLSAGARAVFRALVSGPGAFAGLGSAAFEGGFSPGTGTAQVAFDGDLSLGYDNVATVELGGIVPGTGHDAVEVGGTLVLGGAIDVRLIGTAEGGLLAPGAGDTFVLFRASHITGAFRRTGLPQLDPGLRWDIRRTATEYALAVRPERRPVGR